MLYAADARQYQQQIGEWRIHLGAHKTATTHIQETLAALRPRLAAGGVDAIPMEGFRALWSKKVRRRRWLEHRLILAGDPFARWAVRRFYEDLSDLRLGPPTLIISEENIIGHTKHALYWRSYPEIFRRLRLLRALTGSRTEVHLFFCVREMSAFLPSVYAEALRFFSFECPFEELLAGKLADPPRWTDLVDAIGRAWPEASLKVWCYEDYEQATPSILQLLIGAAPGPLPKIRRPPWTMTPSEAAVRQVERDEGLCRLGGVARARAVAEIYDAAPAGNGSPAFRPLTLDQVARCRQAYAEDCAELDRRGLLFKP